MALAPGAAQPADTAASGDDNSNIDAPGLKYFVFGLFFIFGGITSLNDVIIPKLKDLFTLNYTEAMLVQFCFFIAYAAVGIPGALLVKRIGYMRGAVVGLLTMTAGCLLFIPASKQHIYALFLLALFVLASGVVIVQVVANPLISLLGPSSTTHSRLTFAQAFNSLGTVAFPLIGSFVILGGLASITSLSLTDILSGNRAAFESVGSETVMHLYIGIAVGLALIALVIFSFRNSLHGEKHEPTSFVEGLSLLKRPRFGYGAACIFLYVGAEVAIGSVIINYLMQDHVLNLSEAEAYPMISFYWGGAMVGRLIGSYILRKVSPGLLLATVAVGAITLVTISANSTGELAGYTLLAVGLMNSIMFPTIFSLASEKLGSRAADGSGIINVAICGGAIIPVLYGMVADANDNNLSIALIIPVICYAVIAGYGFYARRPAVA